MLRVIGWGEVTTSRVAKIDRLCGRVLKVRQLHLGYVVRKRKEKRENL